MRAMKVEHRTRSELVREACGFICRHGCSYRSPTSAEARAYRRGMAAYQRGDAVTLEEYRNGMDRRPRRPRKKVS